MIQQVNESSKVVIAITEGAVMGGGFGLACVSDLAIAGPTAKFGMPETTLGVIPAQIAPFVVERIGLTQARRLARSEEHTSELQSRPHLVCRLLLEKKNTKEH